MTATPFTAKGTQPEWRMLYDLVRGAAVDQVFSYADFDTALGRPFATNRSPLHRLQLELLDQDKRVLINVRGTGYRVGKASEHADLATSQRRRARRAVVKGARIAMGADRGQLTPDERKRIDAMEHNLREQADMLRRTDQRVGHVEKHQLRQDDRLSFLEAELKRKGIIDS